MNKPAYRILVVDDEVFNLEMMCVVAEEMGCYVGRANNGKQALEQINQQQYDLILMDCRMPIMDGYEATQILRQSGCDTPVLGLTSSPLVEDEGKAEKVGMNHYLIKPLTTEQLNAFIVQYPA